MTRRIGARIGWVALTTNWLSGLYFATKFKLNVEQEETAGQVLMGVFNKQAICMDSSSVLYLNTKDGQEPLGTLTDVIGLDMTKAPDEVAEMSIQNKIVPVGIALAYYFGLSTLLKELGVEHSRHARGERLKLTADSYTLVFQDEVIVLSGLTVVLLLSSMALTGITGH